MSKLLGLIGKHIDKLNGCTCIIKTGNSEKTLIIDTSNKVSSVLRLNLNSVDKEIEILHGTTQFNHPVLDNEPYALKEVLIGFIYEVKDSINYCLLYNPKAGITNGDIFKLYDNSLIRKGSIIRKLSYGQNNDSSVTISNIQLLGHIEL